MGRTMMDNCVAQRDVVGMMVNTPKATTSDVKTLKNVMVGQSKLDRIRTARDDGSQSVNTNSSNGDLVYRRTRPGKDQVARISSVTVDLHKVARVEQWCNRLQSCIGSRWTDLIGNRICCACAASNKEQRDDEVFHEFSLPFREAERLFLSEALPTRTIDRQPPLFLRVFRNSLREFVTRTLEFIACFSKTNCRSSVGENTRYDELQHVVNEGIEIQLSGERQVLMVL
jgi:hypothetical protein